MPATSSNFPSVKPLLTQEQMDKILPSRRSITSEEFRRQIELHLGRPLLPARKKVFLIGRETWVCC
ncbi:hypothetical protein [Phragmitibacter flavus]|uniref:hypothetical protein n=1 Tax=Phragmitibacter flavus TaxID=2576071 RepID=UPI0010FEC488|nr:hypothetical protein [Phragmitibacter flavus]